MKGSDITENFSRRFNGKTELLFKMFVFNKFSDKAFNAHERTDMYVFLESEKPPRKHFSHNWTQKSVIKTRGRTSKTEQKISIRVLFKLFVLSLDSLNAYFISVLSLS